MIFSDLLTEREFNKVLSALEGLARYTAGKYRDHSEAEELRRIAKKHRRMMELLWNKFSKFEVITDRSNLQ